MSQRSLLEFNHDLSPNINDREMLRWAGELCAYLRSGTEADLPQGVMLKHRRHHSEPDPMDGQAPAFQQIPVKCQACDHRWQGHIAVRCPIAVTVATMRETAAQGCPSCGTAGDNVSLSYEPG